MEAYAATLRTDIQQRLARHPEDLAFLAESLRDRQAVRVALSVALVFRTAQWLPDALYEPMISAALAHSAEKVFVLAAIGSFGHRRVLESLLDRFEAGNDTEKMAVADATYHAWPPLEYEGLNAFGPGIPTPESADRRMALNDVWARLQTVFLREFVNTTSPGVQAALISRLDLDIATCEGSLQPMVKKAITIAGLHT